MIKLFALTMLHKLRWYMNIWSCDSSSLCDNVGRSVGVQQVSTVVKMFKIVHKAYKEMFTIQNIVCDAYRCIYDDMHVKRCIGEYAEVEIGYVMIMRYNWVVNST